MSVQFLERLEASARQRLLSLSRELRLSGGDYLMRRGEPGGDLFLIESGGLEVVDNRSRPEVVISTVGPGALVGEMAFLDDMPRTADVRASEHTECRVWDGGVLRRELSGDPVLASAVYRGLAELVTSRARELAIVGIGTPRRASGGVIEESVQREAHTLVAPTRARWIDAEMLLRAEPNNTEARTEMRRAFETLMKKSCSWITGMGGSDAEQAAGKALARELHPFLIRSQTASWAMESVARQSGDPRLLSHILRNEPQGDGGLGIALDQALLSLPSSIGIRRRSSLAGQTLKAAIPPRATRMMVVSVTNAAPLDRMMPELSRHGATVTCIDGSREALKLLDEQTRRAESVELRLIKDDLARLSMGHSQVHHPPQDLILIDSLVDYLPDRLVASLLGWSARHLEPGGLVVITGLAPWPDAPVYDHLIGWPMIRRKAWELRSLVESVGLAGGVVAGGERSRDPAVVVTGKLTR
ncbi:MAG: CRP-like cAMP-binding protein [Myxococcota bacterium]